ncbi:MAG TPA: hypothetical protein VFO23_04155 [Steroidobacteraceae bacterium]|nr:hypothetical protein [Steroidobacteraceae bacterium]
MADAFQLPHRLTHHVEYQAVPVAFDLEFNLPGLNRLAAQGAEPPGAIAAPHAQGRLAWQFTVCDAFACEGSQFLFVLGLRHSSRNCVARVARRPSAESVSAREETVGRLVGARRFLCWFHVVFMLVLG